MFTLTDSKARIGVAVLEARVEEELLGKPGGQSEEADGLIATTVA